MSEIDDFEKCVSKTEKNGRVSLSCKLGLWSVDSSDSDSVYIEAFHYWRQYKDDGEYYEIIGGESPTEKLRIALYTHNITGE